MPSPYSLRYGLSTRPRKGHTPDRSRTENHHSSRECRSAMCAADACNSEICSSTAVILRGRFARSIDSGTVWGWAHTFCRSRLPGHQPGKKSCSGIQTRALACSHVAKQGEAHPCGASASCAAPLLTQERQHLGHGRRSGSPGTYLGREVGQYRCLVIHPRFPNSRIAHPVDPAVSAVFSVPLRADPSIRHIPKFGSQTA